MEVEKNTSLTIEIPAIFIYNTSLSFFYDNE